MHNLTLIYLEVQTVTIQISTIELNSESANLAYEMGLNVSKTCENALKEAIRRLQGSNSDYASVRNAGTVESIFFSTIANTFFI
jgi:exonuclease VII small subunit